MNFSDAITSHMQWIERFTDAIAQNEQLDPGHIAQDHLCKLGKWLNNDMHHHAGHASYDQLKSSHAEFHRQASEIARLINEQHPDAHQIMFSSTGDFYRASREVILALEKFRLELENTETDHP